MVVELGIVSKSFELTINSKIIWVNLNATKGMYTNSCYQLVENVINRQKDQIGCIDYRNDFILMSLVIKIFYFYFINHISSISSYSQI